MTPVRRSYGGKNPKNYQVWNHARLVSAALCASEDDRGAWAEPDPHEARPRRGREEHPRVDAQAVVARAFDLWRAEPAAICGGCPKDVRNNSAWSHRFVAALGEGSSDDKADAAEIARREMGYAETKLRLAPDNESAWNYLRAARRRGWGRAPAAVQRASEHAGGGAGRGHALRLAEARASAGTEEPPPTRSRRSRRAPVPSGRGTGGGNERR